MSSDWINKAKEAAKQAAEEAKKLAVSAKNANYGEMFDKTKNIAKQATEEAKKAAEEAKKMVGNISSAKKTAEETQKMAEDIVEAPLKVSADPSVILERAADANTTTTTQANPLIVAKLEQVEHLLQEIKQLLKSK
jgi:hypothetical protein